MQTLDSALGLEPQQALAHDAVTAPRDGGWGWRELILAQCKETIHNSFA